MLLHRLARSKVTSWTMVLALLLGSLAPLISHALARRGDIAWQDICRASPADAAAASSVDKPAPMPDAGHAFGHCPCCGSSALALAVPSSAPVVSPPLTAVRAASPRRFLTAARTPYAWSSAQPRAPPFGA